MENKAKHNQQQQVEFLKELFGKSSFADRWTFNLETRKSKSLSAEFRDSRSISLAVRPKTEEEKKELKEIQQKIAEKYESAPVVYEAFAELEINEGLGVGEVFPHYTKVTNVLDETEGEIKHQAGEVILLDVWATWCGPCQRPMQHNQDMLTKNAEKWAGKVRIIAVSVDDDRADVLKRINDKNWDKITHFKLNGWDGEHPVIKDYSIRGIPFVALIDSHGVINYTGHPSSIDIEERINELISGGEKKQDSNNAPVPKMTSEAYKSVKKFIKTGLGEYVSSQNAKDLAFTFSFSVTKEVVLTHNSTKKTYNFPTVSSTVDKKMVPHYTALKNHVASVFKDITVKYEREQIKDVQSEIKKDLTALAKVYEKHNLKTFENKHCVTLNLTIEDGKLTFERDDRLNQHKQLYVKEEELQKTVEQAAEEQRDFAIGKYRSGQFADYLERMFYKGMKTSKEEQQKPKNQEDLYRKYKDILQSKELKELTLDFKLDYDTKFKIYLKRRRVFDYKGEMKLKYYSQPTITYTVRKGDADKFQTEILDKVFTKLDKKDVIVKPNILNTAHIEAGTHCKSCNADLVVPYYFNPFQKEHFCLACGDKKNAEDKTIKQFNVPHNLVLLTNTDNAFLNDVDEYKIGKDTQPKPEEQIDFEFGYSCNGCHEGGKDSRYVCLNCRPGPRRDGGYVEFCKDCIKKMVFDKDEEFLKSVQKRDTAHNSNHIYLKVITPAGGYGDF